MTLNDRQRRMLSAMDGLAQKVSGAEGTHETYGMWEEYADISPQAWTTIEQRALARMAEEKIIRHVYAYSSGVSDFQSKLYAMAAMYGAPIQLNRWQIKQQRRREKHARKGH